ncbi:MAG: FAD-binding oxidoreductase, partial [bacterium]
MFNKVNEEVLTKLAEISGVDNVINDNDSLKLYSRDFTENLSFNPEVIVKPENTLQISSILKLANEYKIPVV